MIAYFCAEYSLDQRLHTFAGGLGILAGDTVKEMGDQGIPFVGVGLFYYKGYLAREYDWFTPESADLQLLKNDKGEVHIISVPIGDRDVYARAWIYRYKSATVYFLDMMLHQNHPLDQQLSYYLYDEDIRIRLTQQMMLGIGGARLLKSIDVEPHVYHMNEGHSVFLSLELDNKVPIVFTNHTVITEGNHVYRRDLIQSMFRRYIEIRNKETMDEFVAMGECEYPDVFSLTHMAIKVARRMNGVSRIHTQKLNELYPKSHSLSITNGIHIPTWFRSHANQEIPEVMTEQELVHIHDENKLNLLLYIQHMTGVKWEQHVLLLGWARRIIQYKQPLALFADALRLHKIISESAIPVRIVISGVPHPKDQWANDVLRLMLSLFGSEKFRNLIVYIPNYNPEIAKMLVAGCDIWINTPRVGLEACGTSGMKAALNGTLQLSTADGWMAEVDIEKIGWKLDDMKISTNIYERLEQDIVPLYTSYVKGQDGKAWREKMMNAHEIIRKEFSTKRMIEEYEKMMWSIESEAQESPNVLRQFPVVAT